MGAPPLIKPIFVRTTYRITEVHYAYGCATVNSAYVCKLYLERHWVTLYLWVRNRNSATLQLEVFKVTLQVKVRVTLHFRVCHFKCSLWLKTFHRESLG